MWRKLWKLTKLNRFFFPKMLEKTDAKPVELSAEEALQYLEKIHPDSGTTAIREKALPEPENSPYKLDIIVPAYNVEAYIDECVQSILNQKTEYPFRVILVDDGAIDLTPERMDAFAKYENVLVLHQKNGGVARARNNGVEHSTAPYLMFVDSDDRLAEGAVQKLMKQAEETGADIVEGSYFNFKGSQKRNHFQKAGEVNPLLDFYGMPWGKVYRRFFFEEIAFPEKYWFEDSVLHQLVYPFSKKSVGIRDIVYERRLVETSAGHISKGNPRSIETVWVTLHLVRDRKQLGMLPDQNYFEYLMNMAMISYHRLKNLDEKIGQAALVVFSELLNETCAAYHAQSKERKYLEESIRKKQYARFAFCCENV